MNLGLSGKKALVTGGSSGIGAGIAKMLAEEGCIVVVHGRDRDRTQATVQAIRDAGGQALPVVADLMIDADAARLEHEIDAMPGTIDILVNNFGGADGTTSMPWDAVTPELWLDTHMRNSGVAVRLIRHLLPAMKAKRWGRIIQVASAAATQPMTYGPDYGAAKAALLNLTVSLAKEVAGAGITSNAISPGIILTPGVEEWLIKLGEQNGWHGLTPDEIHARAIGHLSAASVGRIGRPADIGHAVCMIASPAAGYMTGANIRVDGGQLATVG